MDRLAKLSKKEERFHFSQQAQMFEGVFSRPIFGPLWWWWVFVAGLISMVATKEPGAALRPAFYFIAVAVAVASAVIVTGLLKAEKRKSWLAKQQPAVMAPVLKIGVFTIPWLAAAAVVLSICL